jgi:hypothetical protein
MEAQYSIAKRADGWVISVDGAEILRCNRKSVALRIVRMAMGEREEAPTTIGPGTDAEYGLVAAFN